VGPDTFVVATYCLVRELMQEAMPGRGRLRSRGVRPRAMDDCEVITDQIVGAFLGIDTGGGIHRFGRGHHA
jgi:hypothetical protein